MQLILLSPPEAVPAETAVVSELLAGGLGRFHVRKPAWSRAQVATYLAGIPTRYHARLVLHAHYSLAAELRLGGIHLPAASRAGLATLPPLRPGQTLSTAFHSLNEIRRHRRRYDYVFLSPVFDSLSKTNYPAAFDLSEVADELAKLRRRPGYVPQVIALGGIEAARLDAVQRAGFAGAAVLGAVWQNSDPVATFRALQSIVG